MTQPPNDFKNERDQLERRAHQLRGEVASACGIRPERLQEASDLKETAGDHALQEVQDAETERDLAELRAIDQALERMACGRYGICGQCGEPIDPHRLRAQPAALRCTRCQADAERHPAGACGAG